MKSTIFAVTTAVVLLVVSTPIEGNGIALKNWIDNQKGNPYVFRAEALSENFETITIDNNNKVQFYIQKAELNIAVTKSKSLAVYFDQESIPGSDPIVINTATATNYLPFIEQWTTALIPSTKDFGSLFVTDVLTGCDVWIADHKNKEPLIIHLNANHLKDTPLENLQHKEKCAFEVLKYVNKEYNGYEFVQRISFDYSEKDQHVDDSADEESKESKESASLQEYWQEFKQKHKKIPVEFYDDDSLFYGLYDKDWKFYLKDIKGGEIIMECPEGFMCSLMKMIGVGSKKKSGSNKKGGTKKK